MTGVAITSSIITSSAATAYEVWPSWVSIANSYAITGAATCNDRISVWNLWIVAAGDTLIEQTDFYADGRRVSIDHRPVVPPMILSQETKDQMAREAAEWKKLEAERIIAEQKAWRLLRENLTEQQREELSKTNGFHLFSQSGKKYRIDKGRSRNVRLIEGEGPAARIARNFCIHPAELVPDGDTMLAQKLLLEADESEFLRIANAS